MRIHLSLDPAHFIQPVAGPSKPPLIQLGSEIILIELQGELNWEGDKDDGVVGVLGFERPDKPTLHLGEHHLLHGKIVNIPKPLAIIRRSITTGINNGQIGNGAVEGDAEEEDEEDILHEEENEAEDPKTPARPQSVKNVKNKRKRPAGGNDTDEEEEDEPPLFPPNPNFKTPLNESYPHSSSPILPSSSIKDWSSDLDCSSPAKSFGSQSDLAEEEENGDEEKEAEKQAKEEERRKKIKLEQKKAERKAQRPARTRTYEVSGIVRKKIVFSLRPEPIVTATILPD